MPGWRPYNVGRYRLGQLKGEAVAVWQDGGTRRRFRLGVRSEIEGRAALARFARRADAVAAQSTQTVGAIWAAYIADRERDGKGMAIYRHNWRALEPTFGPLPAEQVTADLCRTYARERFAAGRAQDTVWTELSRLRTCLAWAERERIIDRRPRVWVPRKGQPRARVLTEDEVMRIVDGCAMPHVRLFVILLLCTGARHRALVEMTWDRVDFERGTIDLRVPGVIEPMSQRHRKGRAVVPMNGLARAALQDARLAARTEWVIEYRGQPLTGVRDGLAAACRRAGVAGVTAHTFRHTVASWQWGQVSPEQVARFLGHANTRTTEAVYAKPEVDFLEPAARVLNLKLVR